jgi:hypothetical protein
MQSNTTNPKDIQTAHQSSAILPDTPLKPKPEM